MDLTHTPENRSKIPVLIEALFLAGLVAVLWFAPGQSRDGAADQTTTSVVRG